MRFKSHRTDGYQVFAVCAGPGCARRMRPWQAGAFLSLVQRESIKVR
jgi:hypothetical protein